jgi:sarcosine oxidase subunit beta
VLAHPARSTTAVSGGHLLLQSKRPGPGLELARRSLELVADWAAGQEDELQYRRSGSLVLARGAAEEEALRQQYEALRSAGVDLRWLSGAEARELEPALCPSVTAASFCAGDAQVDPGALAASWLADALAHRAVVTSGVLVESFLRERGAVAGVVASGMPILAREVLLAAGAWSGELAEMAGVSLGLKPRRGVLLRGTPPLPLASRPLLGADYLTGKFAAGERETGFSFQQHPDGTALLGGSREFVGFSPEVEPSLEREIRETGAEYLPGISGVEWTAEVGYRPWTAGGEPRIGASGVPGLYLACGHEGDGVTLAAATAERLCQDLAGG